MIITYTKRLLLQLLNVGFIFMISKALNENQKLLA